MRQKTYCSPSASDETLMMYFGLCQISAPDEGIHYGGEGEETDDPNAKKRGESSDGGWGDLW